MIPGTTEFRSTKRKSWVFLDLPGFDFHNFCFVTQLTRLFMIRFSIHRLVLSMATSYKLSPKRFRKSKPSGKITKKKRKNLWNPMVHGEQMDISGLVSFKMKSRQKMRNFMSQDLDYFRPEPMWRRFHVGKSWGCVLNFATLLNVHQNFARRLLAFLQFPDKRKRKKRVPMKFDISHHDLQMPWCFLSKCHTKLSSKSPNVGFNSDESI